MTERAFENLIAIEGGDGSGKGTQTEILRRYATETLGRDVMKKSFPQYGQPSAYFAGSYLDGKYGQINQVHPDLASLTYAVDRFAANQDLREHLAKPNSLCILDRWVASNLAHQGAKIDNADDRQTFYERILELEYGILQIPKPKINIVLIMPTNLAQANVDKKDAAARSYTTKQRDIHEADPDHLEKAKANYEELCRLYPEEFTAIQCVDDGGVMRSIDDIQREIRTRLNL